MRDFRDAKAMAFSLRDALQVKAVQATHSECLELIAKAFGYDNWNILSAKIEASRPSTPDAAALAPAAANDQTAPKTLHCSFCGKSQHDVRALIAGPAVFVCDECVGLCDDILADRDVWELLKAKEESGQQADPAALDWVRAKSTEEVMAFAERSRRGVERHRRHLRDVESVLAARTDDAASAAALTSPSLAYLKSKPREELLAIERDAQRSLRRYDDMLRLATTALEDRRKNPS
jgi:hypothetical protein